jgi:hypothetical protein
MIVLPISVAALTALVYPFGCSVVPEPDVLLVVDVGGAAR